jgi:hypothetical protein
MGYYIENGDSQKTYKFPDIATDITVNVNDTVNPGVEVFSSIGSGLDSDTLTSKAVAHGILLAVTAFSAEGMHDILDHPKFEHCVKSALERVPVLSDVLDKELL